MKDTYNLAHVLRQLTRLQMPLTRRNIKTLNARPTRLIVKK